MIDRFFTTEINLKRMVWSNESSAEISAGSFFGHIQQSAPEFVQNIAESWGTVYTIWCSKTEDIDPGDTLEIATGSYAGTYSVKNIQINAVGNNQHMEITVIKDTE